MLKPAYNFKKQFVIVLIDKATNNFSLIYINFCILKILN